MSEDRSLRQNPMHEPDRKFGATSGGSNPAETRVEKEHHLNESVIPTPGNVVGRDKTSSWTQGAKERELY